MRSTWWAAAVVGCVSWAAPAFAGEGCAAGTEPSAREIACAVDAYLAPSTADASLVGGPGAAGYDGGFWVSGGSFLLRVNLTIQTRFEYFDWDDREAEPGPGGDLSGFSLPRLTLKLSGDATCGMHYYAELEFGHHGTEFDNENGLQEFNFSWLFAGGFEDVGSESEAHEALRRRLDAVAREAWIEWEASAAFAVRMGLVKTPTTRQLMTPPEMQQFVDVSFASAVVGQSMPGYTDRNRDYGIMAHGALGCDGAWTWMATITNGDGPVHRNVLDGFTSDPLAYGARVNWDVRGRTGYEEGALRHRACDWTAAVGAWVHYYADHSQENPFSKFADRLTWGVDAAAGWGGFSLTAAYSAFSWEPDSGDTLDGWAWLVQVGYLFPDSAFEIAARYDRHELSSVPGFGGDIGATEWGVAVNYYVDGHGNKLTLDGSFVSPEGEGNFLGDTYAGYSPSFDSDAMLLRFQWQLAL
jgi:hypothetical protein